MEILQTGRPPDGNERLQERRPRVEQADDTPEQNPHLRGNACFLEAADLIGARAVITQALDEGARSFYERFGFRTFSDKDPLMLLLRVSELRDVFVG